jgi:hypothetical protein
VAAAGARGCGGPRRPSAWAGRGRAGGVGGRGRASRCGRRSCRRGLDLLPVAQEGCGNPVGRDQIQLLQLGESGLADGGVAGIVVPAVLGDVGRLRLHRPVRRGVGHIEEERLVGPVTGVFAGERHGVIGDGVGVIELVGAVFRFVGDGDTAAIEVAAVAVLAAVLHHVADPGLVRVQPGQEGGPGGATARGVVGLAEANALGGEGVEVRRGNLAAAAAQVRKAHVVRQGHHEVRLGRRPGPRRKRPE